MRCGAYEEHAKGRGRFAKVLREAAHEERHTAYD